MDIDGGALGEREGERGEGEEEENKVRDRGASNMVAIFTNSKKHVACCTALFLWRVVNFFFFPPAVRKNNNQCFFVLNLSAARSIAVYFKSNTMVHE